MWWKGFEHEVRALATERQWQFIKAWEELGSRKAVAERFDLSEGTVSNSLLRLKTRLSVERGIHPETQLNRPLPEGLSLKGTTELRGAEGERRLIWVKSERTKEQQYKILTEAFEDFASTYTGLCAPSPSPKYLNKDLLTCYMWGDPHIGMYAWAEETGSDFNLKIAEELMIEATQRLVAVSPPSEEALIVNLGDFFHADNLENRTARSGHVLDVDTRMSKVYQVGMLIQVACIDAALQKHKKVKVIEAIGNHDDLSSMMLATTLAAWYRNEPRVEIVTTRNKFHWHEFGEVLMCVTHGDNVKLKDMGEIMAAYDNGRPWGRTSFRYAYLGHTHRSERYPGRGWWAESFPTLAGLDAWAASKGFHPDRAMISLVHHREGGELERYRQHINMMRLKEVA